MTNLEKKLGVKKILISNINNEYYKDTITVIVNDDIAIHVVGMKYEIIPLTENGINKELQPKVVKQILHIIKEVYKGQII